MAHVEMIYDDLCIHMVIFHISVALHKGTSLNKTSDPTVQNLVRKKRGTWSPTLPPSHRRLTRSTPWSPSWIKLNQHVIDVIVTQLHITIITITLSIVLSIITILQNDYHHYHHLFILFAESPNSWGEHPSLCSPSFSSLLSLPPQFLTVKNTRLSAKS